MNAIVTLEQSDLLNDLLRAGRGRNKSESIQHGWELVRAEVAREQLAPVSAAEQARMYADMTAEDLEADARLSAVSAANHRGAA
jgi:hypothetical protein